MARSSAGSGDVATKIDPECLLLCFGNQVGLVELAPSLRIEVQTAKLGEAAFQAMLADLVRIAAGLAFACGIPTALPYDRSTPAREDPDYHAFVYLRHVMSDHCDPLDALLPAMEAILREPHRRFERETAHVPSGQARRVEPVGLQRIPGSRCLVPVNGSVAATPLASLLTCAATRQPHLPTHVEETRPDPGCLRRGDACHRPGLAPTPFQGEHKVRPYVGTFWVLRMHRLHTADLLHGTATSALGVPHLLGSGRQPGRPSSCPYTQGRGGAPFLIPEWAPRESRTGRRRACPAIDRSGRGNRC